MLLMPLVVGLVLVSVGYMLASLYPVDGVDLACLLASAAVGAALDDSEHVSGGRADPSDDVLCELHQLCDAELVHDVAHVVELIVGDVESCCWAIFPISASAAHVARCPPEELLNTETYCLRHNAAGAAGLRSRSRSFFVNVAW